MHGARIEARDPGGFLLVSTGPSGYGKSTTLRTKAGLESIAEGKLWIGSQIVNNGPPKDRGIAMVFQKYALYLHRTVYGTIAFGLKLRKCLEIEKRVHQAVDVLGFRSRMGRKPRKLSGGQGPFGSRRAMEANPQVFLFYEPLSPPKGWSAGADA